MQGRVSVEQCTFQINAATRAGGAISMTAGSMEMIESSVKSNYAGEADGGVFINGLLGCCNVSSTKVRDLSYLQSAPVISKHSRMHAIKLRLRTLLTHALLSARVQGKTDASCWPGGEASFQGCVQDANSIGHFASEVLDEIQARRQQTSHGPDGFGEAYRYVNPLAIS